MATESRKNMEQALKEFFVPELRALGFKGSFPHFRRIAENSIDLLTFQFYSAGGSFVVEIGQCPLEGFTNAVGILTPANEVTVAHVFPRLRLGSSHEAGKSDHWFEFGEPNYVPAKTYTREHYQLVAKTAASFIPNQASTWWAAHNYAIKGTSA